jgi:2-polyprenyl-3-methyl-5-hydroxy-6-metoxy-1,4-benzoquinol methylase
MIDENPRELAPDDPAFDISDSADVAALLSAENKHFWHRSRNRYILAKLGRLGISPPARVIELGCGAGCVARELARAGYDTTGVDGHRALIDIARTRAPNAEFHCRDLRSGVGELPAETFDVACLFDVIEHLDHPEQALETAIALVRSGGFVVGTVPALMALWSGIDEHAGHKIRYSRATLDKVLSGVKGARIVEISPFFRSLVPMMWAQRRLIGRRPRASASVQNLTVPPVPVNAALLAMVTLEHMLAPALDKFHVPGTSLWFALKKGA